MGQTFAKLPFRSQKLSYERLGIFLKQQIDAAIWSLNSVFIVASHSTFKFSAKPPMHEANNEGKATTNLPRSCLHINVQYSKEGPPLS